MSVSLSSDPGIPLTCSTNIHLSLFGEVITCDLTALDPDPAVIVRLLKTTQSERANYMIVAAFYRRSGVPASAKTIVESMIQELAKQGVSESDLKPAYLFLAGCESDLARLSEDSIATSKHCAAAQMWFQKVFGKVDPTEKYKEKKSSSFTRSIHKVSQSTPQDDKDSISHLKREVQILRDRNADQARQLAQLRIAKRKIEDDLRFERNTRRKYVK